MVSQVFCPCQFLKQHGSVVPGLDFQHPTRLRVGRHLDEGAGIFKLRSLTFRALAL